jgi:hypothetical protein
MWKPSLWGLAVALAMTASGGADAADYHTYDRTVFLGGAVELGRYIHVRTGCSPNGRDEIKVAKAPSSGSVRVVQKMAASKFSGDFQSCTGRLLPQLFVIYRPHAGFAGLDTVQVDVISPFGNEAIDTYNITVK